MIGPREIMWRRIMDQMSLEQARIGPSTGGFEIDGTVMAAENGAPLKLDYRIRCDPEWRTREVQLTQTHSGRRRCLRLEQKDGKWRIDGRHVPALDGATDVDLSLSPSTNSLPINRLALRTGDSATIRAAYVRFPALEVTPVEQVYTRQGANRYRYQNRARDFEAMLNVDSDGIVIEYSGVWSRCAEGAPAPITIESGFTGALISPGPHAELGPRAEDFGWLIGGWDAELRDFDEDGRIRTGTGEWWFSWVLEGRAIQDVWISPRRGERGSPRNPLAANDRYGTTVRRFERGDGQSTIIWINPVNGDTNMLRGKREGDRIVLLGEDGGAAIRWSFTDLRADSFRWVGERRQPDGNWRTGADFKLRRMS